MAFIQVVEFTSSRIEEMAALGRQFQKETEGRSTTRLVRITVDRDNPKRYLVIAEFDSYEAAMENSNLPETEALADKMRDLADGPATYHNLEVIETYR